MRDSEREPFYHDIAHVIQNTKKIYRLWDSNPRPKSFGRIITVHDHCSSDKISSYTHIIVPNVSKLSIPV